MADPAVTKFKFEVKQDEQKTERKSTKLFGPGDSNVFRKALQDATKAGNTASQGQQSTAEAVEQLHAIYISSVPDSVLDKDTMMQHFSKFGRVKRVYISNVRKSVIVHFENHEVAKQAKMSGTQLQDHKLDIYWSKSAKVLSPGLKKSPQSSPEAGPVPQAQPKATVSRVAEKRNVLPKYTLSDEVKEELRAMAGGDDAKYEERPRGQPKPSAVQVPTKQKAQAVTRLVSRSKFSMVRRNSAGTSPPAQQVVKPKAKTVSKPRTKSGDQPSSADSLLALFKQQALTAEDKYKILEARDKILRKLQSRRLKKSSLVGTCLDMCPEKERYHREITNQVAFYERLPTEEVKMDHQRAVKQYSRSSADQDDTLCHELRPAAVLERSMNYLLVNVMDCAGREKNPQDWFHYLWDRTRSIRKDITQQELCDLHCVALLEQCARFHIHCAEQLVAEDPSVFDQKINTENLTKSLQTLKYMYNDMAVKGETCPCEAEFRAYMVLLNLNDSSFIWELKQVRRDILHSGEVQFALRVHASIHSQNYVKFFKLVRQTTYLNACLVQRYFCQVRTSALLILCRTSCPGRARIQFPVAELMKLLAFENLAETHEFLSSCGLTEYEGENRRYVVMFRGAVTVPKLPPQTYRAPVLIESKMIGSLAQVVYGGPQPAGSSEMQPVQSSFNDQGYLKLDALDIGDVGDSSIFRVPAGEAVPKRKKVPAVVVKTPKLGSSPDVKQRVKKPTSPDKLLQSQPLLSAGSTPSDVKPITYSFAAAMGALGTSDTFTKPIFSFTLAKLKDETASASTAAMEVDSVITVSSAVAGKRGLSGENLSSGIQRRSVKTPESQPHVTRKISGEHSEATTPTRQLGISARISATLRDSPLQEIKSQVQSSKLPVSFSFDSSKSTSGISQVPFLWKPKQVQEEGGKHMGTTASLETTGSSVGFSSSSLFKTEQSAAHNRFREEQDEKARAIKIQQEEEHKRKMAEENRKRLEEEKRAAAQKEFLMSQKAQKVLGMLLSEVTHDICSANLKEMLCAAQAKKLSKEVINSVVTETITDLMAGAIHERRRLLLMTKVHIRKMRAAFEKWRVFATRRKKRREAAENFPPLTLLQNSPEDLYDPRPDQVTLLQFPDHVLKEMSFSKLDMCTLVGHQLLLRANSLDWNSPEVFWKLVVSLPDSDESIYEREASVWAHQMFAGTQHAKPHSKVTAVTSSDVVYSDIHLVNCVMCVSGCASKEPLRGMSGLLFWIPSTTDDWAGARLRLRRAVERRERLPRIPVAVVLVRNMARLAAGDVAEKADLEALVSEGYISEYVVQMPSHNTSQAICATVVTTLQWLARRAPDPRPLVVQPLQHFLDQLVFKAMEQIITTAGDIVFASRVLQSPNNIIYLYNKVLCSLGDYLTDPELAKYSKGAPEFCSLSPRYEQLQSCPQDCGSTHYYNVIKQVLKKAELSRMESWPPTSVHELVQVLESYCRKNSLLDHWPLYSYLESAVEEYFELGGTPDDSSDWENFLRSVNWVKVVEIIVCKKLESLQMLSSSKEHISVAISKKNLSSFLNTFWWFTSEEIDKVVETPFTDNSSNSSCVTVNTDVEYSRERKRRSTVHEEAMDNKSTKRQYKDITREIDASLATIKSVNEEILKILDMEPEMTSVNLRHISVSSANEL